ncbi:MAG: hypothetical protein AAF430_04885 [Myxococcota bacterium]
MSTILKALRRLEEEKAATHEGRPLREEIAGPTPPPSRDSGTPWGAAVLALLLGLSAGAGVFWWMSSGEADGGTTPPTVAAAAPPGEAPAPPPADVRPPPLPPIPSEQLSPPPAIDPPTGPPEKAFASEVEVLARPTPAPRIADANPIAPSDTPKPGSERPVTSSSAARRARQAAADRAAAAVPAPPAEGPPVREAPAPPPEPIRVAKAPAPEPTPPAPRAAPPEPKPAAPEPVAKEPAPSQRADAGPHPYKPAPPPKTKEPAAKTAPPAPRAEVPPPPPPEAPAASAPAFRVERTHWHPAADRRVAWLLLEGESESRRLVEGDVLGELIVKQIEPAAIVLESATGEELRRKIGD